MRWARLKFEALFVNDIRQLLHNFPPGATVSGGEPFWSGAKRCPTPAAFDAADASCLAFITAAASLRAAAYGLKLGARHDADFFAATASAVAVPAFAPAAGMRIAANDKELEEMKRSEAAAASGSGRGGGGNAESADAGAGGAGATWDVDERARTLEALLPPAASLAGFRAQAADFDKDDDLHITLVAACSNLRARSYRIPEADKLTSKGIAGKIIPAIATTTALVAGLVCIELYKLAAGAAGAPRPLAAFRNAYANLALPLFALSEPIAAARSTLRLRTAEHAFRPQVPSGRGSGTASSALEPLPAGQADGADAVWRWSLWDRIDLRGPLRLADLLARLREDFGATVLMLSQGAAILYSSSLPPSKKRERAAMTMAQLVVAVTKAPLAAHRRFITFEILADRDGADLDLPYVRYALSDEELAQALEQRERAAVASAAAAVAAAAAPPV